MSDSRRALINDLVADLQPIDGAGRVGPSLASWSLLAALYSATALVLIEPFRDGAWYSLVAFPAFAVETVVAVLAVLALARAALLSGIPGVGGTLRSLLWPAALVSAWIAFYVVGLGFPAHPVSETGHREHCFLETLIVSLPNLGLMLWYLGRLFPLAPRVTGVLAGAAAAAVPAALMQLACMYSPAHILGYHLVPVAVMAAVGGLLAPRLVVHQRVVRRRERASEH